MFPFLLPAAFNSTALPIHLSHHSVPFISRSHAQLSKMSQHSFSIADSGKTISIKRGDTITIQLNENPTTGYRWSEPSFENSCVHLVQSAFVPPETAAPGAGGMRVLTLKAEQPGETTVNLKNWREWQGDRGVLQRFTLTISVID